MGKSLLIVESSEKAKVIGAMLGSDWIVKACLGHVRDLPVAEMGFDPINFRPNYVLTEKGKSVIARLKQDVERADEVFLATDPDREGEAISWHLAEALRLKSPKRVTYTEVTSSGVRAALAKPRSIDMDLVYAQETRRIADRDVGYSVSPLLSEKFNQRLSAGRVQSPAVRLIVEMERKIDAFRPQEYWTVLLNTHKGETPFSAKLIQFDGKKVDSLDIENKPACDSVLNALRACGSQARVAKVDASRKHRSPNAPFTTSTLSQDAVRKLGVSTKEVMRLAQQLYDGVDIGSGSVGLITYMRTDSVNLADEALEDLRRYIGSNFSKEYLPNAPVRYKSKSANAQEAHEAIRPTSIDRTPQSLKAYLTADQYKLYEMIWKRTLACQMAPADFDTVAVDIVLGGNAHIFRANGRVLAFPGFMAVYLEGNDEGEEEKDSRLPELAEGESIPVDDIAGEQSFTQPPARYSESTLVKTLEEYGIGRPSTYASIISTLTDKGYAILEKKRFKPTPTGFTVVDALVGRFSFIEFGFTSAMEESLDQVAQGKTEYRSVLREFHKILESEMVALRGMQGSVESVVLEGSCPKCHGKVEAHGRTYNCCACDFKLWKEVAGRPLSDDEASALLKDGSLPSMNGFKSRAGKKFSAGLKLTPEGKVEFVFENNGNDSGSEPGRNDAPAIEPPCPKCGGRIHDQGRLFACEKGDFKLWKEIAGRALSEKEACRLISDKEHPPLSGFHSSKAKGKKFTAGLRLSRDLTKVEFVFES